MENYVSLKLDATFLIHGRGLILMPVFDLPKVSGFKPFSANVVLLLPDGKKTKYSAQFLLYHFNLNNGIGQWNIVILLPKATKNDFPDGSEIAVTEETASRLEHIK